MSGRFLSEVCRVEGYVGSQLAVAIAVSALLA